MNNTLFQVKFRGVEITPSHYIPLNITNPITCTIFTLVDLAIFIPIAATLSIIAAPIIFTAVIVKAIEKG